MEGRQRTENLPIIRYGKLGIHIIYNQFSPENFRLLSFLISKGQFHQQGTTKKKIILQESEYLMANILFICFID